MALFKDIRDFLGIGKSSEEFQEGIVVSQRVINVEESEEEKNRRLNAFFDFYHRDYRVLMKEMQKAGVGESDEIRKELNIWHTILEKWKKEDFKDFEESPFGIINENAIKNAFDNLKEKKVPAKIKENLRRKEVERKRKAIAEAKSLEELLSVLDSIGGLESQGSNKVVFVPKSLREKVEDTMEDVFGQDLESLPPQGFQKGSPYLYKLRDVLEVYGLEEAVARLLTEEVKRRKEEATKQAEIKANSPLVSGEIETEDNLVPTESIESGFSSDMSVLEQMENFENFNEAKYQEYLEASRKSVREIAKRFQKEFTPSQIVEIAKKAILQELEKRKEKLREMILGDASKAGDVDKLIQKLVQESI